MTQNHEDGAGRSAEEAAIGWSDQEYRKWVQSQIASKILKTIATIGIGSIIAVTAAYVGFHGYFLKRSKDEVAKQVQSEIKPTIEAEVSRQILQQSGLVDKVIVSAVEEVDSIIGSKQFQDRARHNIEEMLKRTDVPRDVILMAALERASDTDEIDAVRVLGIELYALLHGGERSSDEVDPMRAKLAEIVESGAEKKLSPKMIRTVLEHYPIGEHGPRETDTECSESVDDCIEWDTRLVDRVLMVFSDLETYGSEQTVFADFVGRIPVQLTDRVMSWIRENKEFDGAQETLREIVATGNTEVLSRALDHIVGFATEEGDPRLRSIGLDSLARIPRHAEFPRHKRANALRSVWNALSVDDLEAAFGVLAWSSESDDERSPSALMSRVDVVFESLFSSIGFESDSVSAQTFVATQTRRAVVGLIRVGRGGDIQSAPDGVNDWEHLLKAVLSSRSGQDMDALLRSAWAMRIQLDKAANYDVSWAADKLLEGDAKDLLGTRLREIITANAVTNSSNREFDRFSQRYLELLQDGQSTLASVDVLAAIIERRHDNDENYEWIVEVIGTYEHLFEHLMDGLAFLDGVDVLGDERARFEYAARRALRAASAESSTSGHRLSSVIVDALTRSATSPYRFWNVAAAVEESGLLAKLDPNHPGSDALRQRMQWIGTPIGEDVERFTPPVSIRVPLAGDEAVQRNRGGIWYLVDATDGVSVRTSDLHQLVELVIMDYERTRTVRRLRPGNKAAPEVSLAPGLHAVAFRVHKTQDSVSPSDTVLSVVTSPEVVPIRPSEDPIYVFRSTDFIYDGQYGPGHIELLASLQEGSVLRVQTVDDVVSLVNRIGHIDQTTYEDILSKVSDVEGIRRGAVPLDEEVGSVLDAVARLDFGTFRSLLERDMTRLGNNSLTHPQQMFLLDLVEQVGIEGHVEIRDAQGVIDPDTYVRILRQDTRDVMVEDDDGGEARYSRLEYYSPDEEDVIVHVTGCCPTPFEQGNTFLIQIEIASEDDAYDGFRVGDYVRLGRHEGINGDDNWALDMDKYVGCLARIVERQGQDGSGSPTVTVDLQYPDEERDWVWRTRSLEAVPEGERQPEECQEFTPGHGVVE